MADGQVVIDILAEDKEYKKTVEALNAHTKKSVESTAKAMSAAGKTMTMALTAPILAVGALSIKAAIDFESSFAGVRKTTDATEAEFTQLAQASKDMSEAKVVSANQINDIMALGSQLGIAKGELVDFSSTIADLDVATNMNAEEAATQIAQYANITKMAQSDTDRFGSTIVELGNNMATTEADIMSFAMRIAGAGSQVGMSDAEILALSASLASVGINAEAGGTAISTVISQIDKDVAHGSASLETWAQAAKMSAEDFASAWKEDAVGTLQRLMQGMDEATASGGNMNLMLDELGVSSLRQTDVMKRMSNASGLLADSLGMANGAWESNTALANEAAARYMTTESQMAMLQNKMTNIASTMGGPLLAGVNAIIDGAEPFIAVLKDIATGFATMDESQRNMIVGAALFIAGLGPVAMAGSKLLTVTKGMSDAYKAVKVAQTAATTAQLAGTAITAASGAATSYLSIATTNDARAKVADTAATGALAVAQGVATATTTALSVALGANPVGVVLVGVLLLVAGITALAVAMSNSTKEQEKLTQASQKQKAVVDAAQKSYDEAVASTGEFSDAADSAKAALDRERASFEASKETVEQFNERIEKAIEAHDELMATMAESEAAAHSQVGALGSIRDSIIDLAAASDGSAESQANMAVQIAALEELYPGAIGLIDASTLATDANSEAGQKMITTINGIIEAERNRILQTDAQERYAELVKASAPLLKAQADAQAELTARSTEYEAELDALGGANAEYQYVLSQSAAPYNTALTNYHNITEAIEDNARKMQEASDEAAAYALRQGKISSAAKNVIKGEIDKAAAVEEFGVTEGEITAEITRYENEQAVAVATAKSAMASAIDDYIAKSGSFARAMQSAGLDSETLAARLSDVGMTLEDVTSNVMTAADALGAGMQKMAKSTEVNAADMITNMQGNTAFFDEYANNLTLLMANAGTDAQRELVAAIQQMPPGEGAAIAAQLVADINAGVEGQGLFEGMANSMQAEIEASARTALAGVGVTFSDEMDTALQPAVDTAGEKGDETGASFADKTAQSATDGSSKIKAATQGAVDTAISQVDTSGAKAIGTQMSAGVANGIYASGGTVGAAMASVVRAAIERGKAAAEVASPSKKTRREIGQNLGKGAALGVLDEKEHFQEALAQAFDISAFSYQFPAMPQPGFSSQSSAVVNNYYSVGGIDITGDRPATRAVETLMSRYERLGKM